jgi:hypothetical protein
MTSDDAQDPFLQDPAAFERMNGDHLDNWDPRDSEIERLRWWLEHILRSRTSAAIDLREMAHNALEGDAQGPPHQNRGP